MIDTNYKKCFICGENFLSKESPALSNENNINFSSDNPSNEKLNEQLSVVLFFRRVIGLRQDVLAEFILAFGNPGSWEIKFCSPCSRLFREVRFIQNRLVKLRVDLEEITHEIRTLLKSSSCSNDVSGDDNVEKLPVRRGVGRPRKSAPVNAEPKNNSFNQIKFSEVQLKLRHKIFEECEANQLEFIEISRIYSSKILSDSVPTSAPISVNVFQHPDEGTHADEDVQSNFALFSSKRRSKPSSKRDKALFTETHCEERKVKNVELQEVEQEQNQDDNESTPTPVNQIRIKFESHNEEDESLDFGVVEHQYEDSNDWFETETEENEANDNEEDPPNSMDEEEGRNSDDSEYKPKKKRRKKSSRKEDNHERRARFKVHQTMKTKSFQNVPEGTDEDLSIDPEQNEDGLFQCTKCSKSFKKKFSCCIHILKNHYEDPMPYHCHVCTGRRFYVEKFFRKHMTRFHQGAMCPFDEDYQPELHSAETLMEKVVYDSIRDSKDKTGLEPNQDADLQSDKNGKKFLPSIPDEVLAKFQDHPTEIFYCTNLKCKRKFSSEILRDAHIKLKHQGIENPFDCDYCQRKFAKRTKLFEHLALAHFSNQYSCNQCGSRFQDKISLEGHVRRVHLGDNTPFKCTMCHQSFIRRLKLNAHMKKKHGTSLPPIVRKRITKKMVTIPKINSGMKEDTTLKCWVCTDEDGPLKFNTVQEKKKHMEENHTGVTRQFKCSAEDCSKTYSSKTLLNNHIRKTHPDQEPVVDDLICPDCGLAFDDKQKLDDHVANHHIQSPHICIFCGKQFREKYYLQHHEQQRHYKELKIDPFKCDICSKILNTAKSLKHHKIIVHQKNPKFKCMEMDCGFGSMYPKSLQIHIERQHLKIKSAICPVCSQTFSNDTQLTSHLRCHTGEKPYKCLECGKAFSDNPTYNRHVEAHAGRIHKCPVESCTKEFKTRHAFRVHLKLHQKKGVLVEIPEFRYENDDEESKDGEKNEASANVIETPKDVNVEEDQMPYNSSAPARIINDPICVEDTINDSKPPVLLAESFIHPT